jgi:hypothetical protein
MTAFRDLYAPMANQRPPWTVPLEADTTTSTAAKNAAMACKVERADANFATGHSGKSFAEWYGKNENDKNAFGKCVSSKAKDTAEEQQQATINAAKKCKAERADTNFASGHGGKSFAEWYGTNTNKKNAFGKCVSKLAKQGSSS